MSHGLEELGCLEDIDVDQSTGVISVPECGKKPMFIMVYGSYCGHCLKCAPAFKAVHDELEQKKVFMCTLQTDSQNPKTRALMTYFVGILANNGIQFTGVPTFLQYKNGKYREFNAGRRTEDDFRRGVKELM